MQFKCEDVLSNVASTIYYFVFNYKTRELEEFNILKYGGYTNWEKSKFNPKFVEENMFPEDKENDIKTLVKMAEENLKYVEMIHRFYTKNRKIKFIKAKVTLVDRDDERLYCIGIDEDVTNEKEYELIINRLYSSPHIGIIIFREKILYCNEYMKKLLGIENFDEVFITDLIKNVSKKDIEKIVTQRKEGKQFFVSRQLEVVYKKRRFFFTSHTNTILFKGIYAGMSLLVDISDVVKREKFSKIVDETSEYILKCNEKFKFFTTLINVIRKSGYKVYIKSKGEIYGDKIDIALPKTPKYNKNGICIDGSLLVISFESGKLVIKSEYENEFEEKFLDEYKKIKKLIDYAINNIKQLKLLNILKEAIEKSYQWVLITDKNGTILYANEVVEKLSGYSKGDIIGRRPDIFKSNYHDKKFYENLWDNLHHRKIFEDIFIEKNIQNEYFYLKLKIIPVEVEGDVFYVALGIDITKEKKLEDSLIKDELTGLLNRKGFLLEADDVLKNDEVYILILIDIRNFKAFNQIKGNFYGDLILKEFANFLQTFFYDKDLIGRIGADEFAILAKIDDISSLFNLLHQLLSKIKKFKDIGIDIGIAIYPKDADNINSLIEKASIALSHAKKEEENKIKFYTSNLKRKLEDIFYIKSLISEALEKDEFVYYFQPYYEIKTKKIVGAESLIRIKKENKIIFPNEFIDYAEKSGLIKKIEETMFKKLNLYYRKLQIPISINISANSFKDKKHIIKFFEKGNIPIVVELTEREVASDISYTKELFEYLKSKNLKIAIDDFGTGYSTFTYVKELNFDILKIDMSFIKNITENRKDFALVKTIITMAKEFNLKTVAEGVETKKQFDLLKDLGCDIIQGYLISKPLPLEEAVEFIKNFSGID